MGTGRTKNVRKFEGGVEVFGLWVGFSNHREPHSPLLDKQDGQHGSLARYPSVDGKGVYANHT